MQNNTARHETTEDAVEYHYSRENPTERLYEGLRAAGIDVDSLAVDSLAPVDAFHFRGREATVELADRVELGPDDHVLDVGCGIGGSARYLAERYGCKVTGVDLTAAYCDLGNELSAQVGLADRTFFRQASALDLPFDDASFDIAWTEHVQMNIPDKVRFYSEMARVVRPGGALVFHDVFAGPNPGISYPTPWASDADSSFLIPGLELRKILDGLGLSLESWEDCTKVATPWFQSVRDRIAANGPPPLGVHLLMGDSAATKIENVCRGLESAAIATIQAVLRKPTP